MRDAGYQEVQSSHSKQGSWVISRDISGICGDEESLFSWGGREKCRWTRGGG